jgi:hypothetical protein
MLKDQKRIYLRCCLILFGLEYLVLNHNLHIGLTRPGSPFCAKQVLNLTISRHQPKALFTVLTMLKIIIIVRLYLGRMSPWKIEQGELHPISDSMSTEGFQVPLESTGKTQQSDTIVKGYMGTLSVLLVSESTWFALMMGPK